MKMKILPFVSLYSLLFAMCSANAAELTVKAVNHLSLARSAQTIELSLKDLAPLGETNLQRIHVSDDGKEVLCQAVDTDYDEYHRPDMVIFQADFRTNETKTFTVSVGRKQEYKLGDFKAYGRFARERFDDFAWENDRIAHRTYGKALETWKGEPLTSSTIDIWSKRTPKMVINEWYMVDNYHADAGEGADFYSAGPSRGCGGSGIWAADKLWTAKNFVESRVLANGPIRVLFELVYEPFDANGAKVSEVRRISLDAGSQLDHIRSSYKVDGDVPLVAAVGLKKVNGEAILKVFSNNAGQQWLAKWEPMEKNAGQQGLAMIIERKAIEPKTEDRLNHLLRADTGPERSISYWAGFAWDKAGRITSREAWEKYVDEFALGLGSPIRVSVSAK